MVSERLTKNKRLLSCYSPHRWHLIPATTRDRRQTIKRARIVLTLLLSIMTMLGLACDGGEVLPSTDYISLMDNLREAGATVDTGGLIRDRTCFSVDSRVMTANGSNIRVFEYEDATVADTGATFISPDGSTISNNGKICSINWVAPPHFYKASKLIVLYVGDSQAVIDLLETVLGSQFAGS